MSKKVGDIMDDIENPEAPMPSRPRFVEGRERAVSGPKFEFVGRLMQFLRDVRAEMKRVSWPSAKDVKNTTIITLIAVIFFAIYLFLADQLWTFLLTRLSQFLNWLTGA